MPVQTQNEMLTACLTLQFILPRTSIFSSKFQFCFLNNFIFQVLHLAHWFLTTWYDEYLMWNAEDFHNITELTLPPTSVWLPDIALWNAKGNVYNEQHYKLSKVKVTSAGKVFWTPGGEAQIYCSLNLKTFPFDTQTCSIWIMPDKIQYPYEQLQSPEKGMLVDSNTHGTWQITETWTESSLRNDTSGSFSVLFCYIVLKRKPVYFVVHTICPCLVLGLLNLFVFVLPFNSGEKISLGSTVLMSFFIFMVILVEDLPQNSDSFPIFAIFLGFMILQSVVSIMCATVVICIVNYQPSNQYVSRAQVRIYQLCIKMKRVEYTKSPEEDNTEMDIKCSTDNKTTPLLSFAPNKLNEEQRYLVGMFLDKIFLVFFSASFCICTMAFFISVLT